MGDKEQEWDEENDCPYCAGTGEGKTPSEPTFVQEKNRKDERLQELREVLSLTREKDLKLASEVIEYQIWMLG